MDDNRHGTGVTRYSEASTYYPGGGLYEGEWRNDLKEGRGRMVFANGDEYEGEWLDNKRHGRGRQKSGSNGEVVEGLWALDEIIEKKSAT